jgi:hypothetical protein
MTPQERTEAFTVVTDEVLLNSVLAASTRLVVVAPALSKELAEAVAKQWRALGPQRVTVILDSDAEVYRLGYGEVEALDTLSLVAQELGAELRRQPGVRIGLIVADDQMIVFVPTAALIEAGPNTRGGTNAIRLGQPPTAIAADLGLESAQDAQIGRGTMNAEVLQQIREDLAANPPQRFDLARKMKVFNAFIEFVDLEVRGTALSQRTVTIPSYLLAVTNARTRRQLQARFQLVPPGDTLSGDALAKHRRRVTAPYLVAIPLFGTVIMRRDKPKFEAVVVALRTEVQKFAAKVKAGIQEHIDRSVNELVRSFMPSLSRRPPKEWYSPSGERPSRLQIEDLLRFDLASAFGSADELVGEMKVHCAFKGVTYELLNDPAFREAASEAIPELGDRLHSEFDAAQGQAIPQQTESKPE